jgi:uncharacterized protein YeaO (DUF488 family)
MGIRVLRLGTDRVEGEGLRIGTVRRPPRGVPKADYISKNWYDVWLPNLSPSPETMKLGRNAKTDREWNAFKKKYRAEMATSENVHIIELLAALSHRTDFSVGCYCKDEARCHRSVLKELFEEKGANVLSEHQ